ncbi:MAG: DUF3617 family protein [Burkholderiaceae bacterium]|nr:DUF3617 family protein [Burkholderiaceae bacterium]
MKRTLLVAAVAALLSSAALADVLPKRKAGLWEATSAGGPLGTQTIEQCVDAATDDMLGMKDAGETKCTDPVVSRNGNRYRVQFACEGEGVKSTFDGNYLIPRDTEFSGEMKMRFDPPQAGMTGMDMKTTGRWVGPCRDGMKPGDVVMKGMPGLGQGMDLEQMRRMGEELQKNLPRLRQGQPAR